MSAATSHAYSSQKQVRTIRTQCFTFRIQQRFLSWCQKATINLSQCKMRKEKERKKERERGAERTDAWRSKDSLPKNNSGLQQHLDTFSGNKAKACGLHFLSKEIWVGILWDPRCNNKYRYLTRLGRRRQNISVFT